MGACWNICRFSCFSTSWGGGVTWSSHDRCSGCLIRPGRPGRIRAQGSLQGTSPEKQDTPQGLRFHQVRVAGAILFSVAVVPTVRGESHRSLHGCQAETNSSQNPMDSTETSYSQKGGEAPMACSAVGLHSGASPSLLLLRPAFSRVSSPELPQHVSGHCHNSHCMLHTLGLKPTHSFSKVRSLGWPSPF